MTISTKSAFTYGHDINSLNEWIDFSEDGMTELSTSIEIGAYSLQEFTDKIASALNEIGDNDYTVTLDRTTRKYTISTASNFSLYVTTGNHSAINALLLMGFTSNKTGSNSYTSDIASGSVYYPQTILREYVSFNDIEETVQAKVNESSDGATIEVVSFGTRNKMECNIKYATDILGQGYIENNPTGVSDLRIFLQYITKKKPIEFIPDREDFLVYDKCILDSTSRSSDGVGFQLRELYAEKLAHYFETGKLVFRRV